MHKLSIPLGLLQLIFCGNLVSIVTILGFLLLKANFLDIITPQTGMLPTLVAFMSVTLLRALTL
ncbi:hypothetical protein V8C37DRAFT_369583 [Trichoderma ceciliae]